MLRIAFYLFLVTSSMGFLQPFVPLYMDQAGLSRFDIGLVTGIGSAMGFLVQPILGRLSDRLDRRRPFICISAAMAGAAYMAFPFVSNFWSFMLLVALGANGFSYLQTAGGVLVGRLVQSSAGGSAYANLRVWGSVGYIVVSLITGFMLGPRVSDRDALDRVFHFGPSIFFVIAILSWWLPDERRLASNEPAVHTPIPENLKRFLFAYFGYVLALYGASGFLSIYIRTLADDARWITGTFAAGVVVEVLVMRWSGRFSDRYGRRPALAFSFVLLPVRLLLYVPATGPLWVLAVQSLHGINFGIVGAVAVAFANDLATDRTRGESQARLTAVAGLATALGPVVLGGAAQYLGLPAMFMVAAGIAAVAATVLVFMVEDSHPDSASIAGRVHPRWSKAVAWLDRPPKRRANPPEA